MPRSTNLPTRIFPSEVVIRHHLEEAVRGTDELIKGHKWIWIVPHPHPSLPRADF